MINKKNIHSTINDRLFDSLQHRKNAGNFRTLPTYMHYNTHPLVDFTSNDYLGLRRCTHLATQAAILYEKHNSTHTHGSGGSRLLAGTHPLHILAELKAAEFWSTESALLFNSGYDANLGFFATIPSRHDTIVYDELCHASIRDGIKLGGQRAFAFRHNDPESLRAKLQFAKGDAYVVTEGVFSMDGDTADLQSLSEVCIEAGAALIIDEAHSFGVIGDSGHGIAEEYNIPYFAKLVTFGKAGGGHGALWLTNRIVNEYLINFCRSFIYTTAMPPLDAAYIVAAIERVPTLKAERQHLQVLRTHLIKKLQNCFDIQPCEAGIVIVPISGNHEVSQAAAVCRSHGLDVRAILSPTVPSGKERLRLCLHSYNTEAEIDKLSQVLLAHKANSLTA